MSNPTPNIHYPTIYPAFHNLGLSIPNEFLLYNQITDASEIMLPFDSPENVLFDTRLMQGDEAFVNQAIAHYRGSAASNSDNSIQNRTLYVIFSKSGKWVFHVYATKAVQLANDSSGSHCTCETNLSLIHI